MKTLKSQIDEIKNSNMSMTAKKAALVEIGIRPHELWLILEPTEYTFGVEIECNNVSRGLTIERAAANGITAEFQGYNHCDSRSIYRFVPDASISGILPAECVTPVLTNNRSGFDSLKRCCTTLKEVGARVNRSCGLHVHVAPKKCPYSDEHYVNVFANYQMLEAVIDSFMAASRRGDTNQFSRSISRFDYTCCHTIQSVRDAMYSRYFKVNPCSYSSHGTIEFRQHQGTTDFKKIQAWVKFCVKLVEWSRTHRLTSPVASIDDIEFLTNAEKRYFKARAAELA